MAMRPAILVLASVALAGCTSSARFGDFSTASVPPSGSERIDRGFGRSDLPPPAPERRPSAADQDVIPGGQQGETGTVESGEIAPPTVAGRSDVGPSAIEPALRPSEPGAQPQIMQPEPQRGGAPAAQPPVVSAMPRQERPTVSSATSIAGTWTVTDAGDRCRITLTSTPLFEFYRASPQNCRAPSLARINAWEQRGSEVVLLQPGGRVAARLSPQGGGAYSGATATGAPVSMAR
ncbi:MAG: AprI/Inh family metalloprotease inhibitor [Phreatobacter sp.]|uniref:AprI/Inh family metalloprotease inhibitor n=1 Tax=Phreatobacter sp. TaxID=1966341 RepID=UPI001A4F9FA7|nr:AprI/Inh family metalloprotease inhibitor [Phreatobacter sp.]MBL8569164.1 AprI/Inh family metalloprotease inhibitor [Phreatobacter sp.]